MAIFPWEAVKNLPGLWLYPLASTPQLGRKLRWIYDLSWGGLNVKAAQAIKKEVMRFGRSLHRLINCILLAGPSLGSNFMNKVNLADAYMRILVILKDVPAVYFLVPREKNS